MIASGLPKTPVGALKMTFWAASGAPGFEFEGGCEVGVAAGLGGGHGGGEGADPARRPGRRRRMQAAPATTTRRRTRQRSRLGAQVRPAGAKRRLGRAVVPTGSDLRPDLITPMEAVREANHFFAPRLWWLACGACALGLFDALAVLVDVALLAAFLVLLRSCWGCRLRC